MDITKKKLEELVITSKSKREILEEIGWSCNGSSTKKLDKLLTDNGINFSKFVSFERKSKYRTIQKECPVCGKQFEAKLGHSREKKTCSYSCSNSLFRSGENNPNWKEDSYRTTCFLYHKKECIVCKENKIVEVHHFDGDHDNNEPKNLMPLCPTHHKYWHSRHRNEILEKVIKYREEFIKSLN